VDLQPGFNLSAQTETWIRALMWIRDRWQVEAPRMSFGGLFIDLESDDEKKQMEGCLRDFGGREWIALTYAPFVRWEEWNGEMTPSGRDMATDIERRRTSQVERTKKSRDASLYWLYTEAHSEQGQPGLLVVEAMGTYGSYLGSGFTAEEIFAAGKWLEEGGFVKSAGAWSRELVRPELTRKGTQVVEREGSVNDEPRGASQTIGTQTNNTFQGPGTSNVVSGGTNVTINNSTSISDDHRQQMLSVADSLAALREHLGLDDERDAQAEEAEAEVRQLAADPAATQGICRRALQNVSAVAVMGSATAVGNAVVATVQQALTAAGWA
jgi:hypothetical protein